MFIGFLGGLKEANLFVLYPVGHVAQLISYSFIEKEASRHVEGFGPNLALVTIGSQKELEERQVVSHIISKMSRGPSFKWTRN